MYHILFVSLMIVAVNNNVLAADYSYISVPQEHIPHYFNSFPKIRKQCAEDTECPFKDYLNVNKCWGYEDNCPKNNMSFIPTCPGDHRGWVKDKKTQIDTFFTQGDFGFIKEQRNELTLLCEPTFAHDSSLDCSKQLRFCRGRNIMINFTDLATRKDPVRYNMDVLKDGQIAGHCRLNLSLLNENLEHRSPLQSWAPEIEHFREVHHIPGLGDECDITIEKPTYLMKIDATINMYHHFCDFFNLYASLHVNSSHFEAFSTDVNILIWETYTYASPFSIAFKAFSENPLWNLKQFAGKNVCFKNIVFPLLPRMIFGLYYNTPLIQGCERSGLFDAFSKHVLHRLNVRPISESDELNIAESKPSKVVANKTTGIKSHKNDLKVNEKIKVTFLSRDTKYRRVLNEDDLLEEIKKNDKYIVKRIVYDRNMPFTTQLSHTMDTDILVGMHGAGLTHLLFLPETSAIFELYNCEDVACYYDLARLKGVKYITWENQDLVKPEDEGHHPDGGHHPKFTNYSFDVKEFARLVLKAADHVSKQKKIKATLLTHDEL